MFFAVQMILAVIIGILVRMESINIYLTAKNEMISELLKKEAKALDLDNSNPSPSWCFDYWKAHYAEFSTDIEALEENFTEEEVE